MLAAGDFSMLGIIDSVIASPASNAVAVLALIASSSLLFMIWKVYLALKISIVRSHLL